MPGTMRLFPILGPLLALLPAYGDATWLHWPYHESPSGNFNDSANWVDGELPDATDFRLYLDQFGSSTTGVAYTVDYFAIPGVPSYQNLLLGAYDFTDGLTFNLTHGEDLTISDELSLEHNVEVVHSSGTLDTLILNIKGDSLYNHLSGTLLVSHTLGLYGNADGSPEFRQVGPTSTSLSANQVVIEGDPGTTPTFDLGKGTLFLQLGDYSGLTAPIRIGPNGRLDLSNDAMIIDQNGYAGLVIAGGLMNQSDTSIARFRQFIIGFDDFGEYRMQGGTLEVTDQFDVGANSNMGTDGYGLFLQTGGDVEVLPGTPDTDGVLRVGSGSPGAALSEYRLEAGTLQSNYLFIESDGRFTQSAGTTASSGLMDFSGDYVMEGGSLTATSLVLDEGDFLQSAGTLTLNVPLPLFDHYLDIRPGSTYLYHGGSLVNAGDVDVEGTFDHGPGQTHATGGNLIIASGGRYLMKGTALDINGDLNSSGTLEADNGTITGNSLNFLAGQLDLGGSSFEASTLDIADATVDLQTDTTFDVDTVTIGSPGGTQLTLSGHQLEVLGDLEIGATPGESAELEIAPSASLTLDQLQLGDQGTGTLTNSGSFTAAGSLFLDGGSTLFSSGGTTSGGELRIDHGATYRQTAGSGNFTEIDLGDVGEIGATFELIDGATTTGTIVLRGDALLHQTGGSLGFTSLTDITFPGDDPVLLLEGGTLTGGSATFDGNGPQPFRQTGGTASFTGLSIDGTSVLLEGGTTTVSGTLATSNGGSVMLQSGGSLQADALQLTSPADLAWTGGSLAMTGNDITIGTGGDIDPGLILPAGLAFDVPDNLSIIAGGTLTTQGTLTASNLFLSGDGLLAVSGGTTTVNAATTLAGTSQLQLSGTGSLTTATLDLAGDPSRLQWTGGSLELTGSGLALSSTSGWGNALTVDAGRTLTLAGTLTIEDGASFTQEASGSTTASALTTAGNGRLEVGGGNLHITGTATIDQDDDEFSLTGGTTTIDGNLLFQQENTDFATADIDSTAILQVGGDLIAGGSESFSSTNLRQTGSSEVHVDGSLVLGDGFNSGSLDDAYFLVGTSSLHAGTLAIGESARAAFWQYDGTTTTSSRISLGNGSAVGIYRHVGGTADTDELRVGAAIFGDGGYYHSDGLLDIAGPFDLAHAFGSSGFFRQYDGTTLANSITIGAHANFDSATFHQTGGTTTVAGAVVNHDTLIQTGGSLAAAALDNHGDATLGGPLTADLNNHGNLEIGALADLSVTGNLGQSATGTLALGIEGAPAEADDWQSVEVNGTLALAGALALDFNTTAAFAPQVGDTWTLLSGSSLTGTFETFAPNAPNLPADLALVLEYDASSVRVVIESVVPPKTYATWAAEHGLAGDDALKDEDPDHDGHNNLIEFGLGTDPNQFGPDPVSIGPDAGYLTLSFAKPSYDPVGVSYLAEHSTDLSVWSDAVVVEDSDTLYTARAPVMSDSIPAGFMRLEVVDNP